MDSNMFNNLPDLKGCGCIILLAVLITLVVGIIIGLNW